MTIICHNKGRYNFYSTVSDGFTFSSSLTYCQVVEFIREEYGKKGLELLDKRIERAHKKGTSSMMPGDDDLKSFLICNRAGKDEKHLTHEECIKEFLS